MKNRIKMAKFFFKTLKQVKNIVIFSYKNKFSTALAYLINPILVYLLIKSLVHLNAESLPPSQKDALEELIPLIFTFLVYWLGNLMWIKNLLNEMRKNIYSTMVLGIICFFIKPIKCFIINYLSWKNETPQ